MSNSKKSILFHVIITEVSPEVSDSATKVFADTLGIPATSATQIFNSAPIVLLADASKADVKALKPRLLELSNKGIAFRITTRDTGSLPKVNWPIRPSFAGGLNFDADGASITGAGSLFVCPCCGESFMFKRLGNLFLGDNSTARVGTVQGDAAPVAEAVPVAAAVVEAAPVEEAPIDMDVEDDGMDFDAPEAELDEVDEVLEAELEEVQAEELEEVEEELEPLELDEPEVVEAELEPLDDDDDLLELDDEEVEEADVLELDEADEMDFDDDELETPIPGDVEAVELKLDDDEPLELEEAEEEVLELDEVEEVEEAEDIEDFNVDDFDFEDLDDADEVEELDLSDGDDIEMADPVVDDGGAAAAPATSVAVKEGSGDFNVFLSKIKKKDRQKQAAELIAEIRGCGMDEAMEMAGRAMIPVAKGVSDGEAKDILARFKKLGVAGRKLKKR